MASQVLSPIHMQQHDPCLRLHYNQYPRNDTFQFRGSQGNFPSVQTRSYSHPRTSGNPSIATRTRPQINPARPSSYQTQSPPDRENFLRRKTPSGTLNVAYDGSNMGGNAHLHHSKHLQLPNSSKRASEPHLMTGAQPHFALSPMEIDPQYRLFGSNLPDGRGASWSSFPAWEESAQPKWSLAPQVDSMLNNFQTYVGAMDWQYNSQQGPTVMQPPHQPPLGPTASQGQIPYGQIWPNGFFNANHQTSFRPDYHLKSPQPSIIDYSQYPLTREPLAQSSSNFLNVSQSHTAQDNVIGSKSSGNHSFFKSKISPWASNQQQQISGQFHQYGDQQASSPCADPATARQDALLFAHEMYSSLVSTYQSIRKNGSSDPRQQTLFSPMPLANIFPEPLTKSQSRNLAPLINADRSRHIRSQYSPVGKSTSFSTTSEINFFNGPVYGLSGSFPSSSFESNPRSGALFALDVLGKLCTEVGSQWTDGMLLCGSLRYALGDYPAASHWFYQVLEVDQSHVEAISNLAATLLALSRRQDAEQLWRTAVSHRPSYFEAVEHLVGLLCFDRRHREAIQVIDHVQAALRISTNEQLGGFANGFWQPSVSGTKSRYCNAASENGRLMALLHAKGNLLYNMQDHQGAASAFEEVVLIAVNQTCGGIDHLVQSITAALSQWKTGPTIHHDNASSSMLLAPDRALQTAKLCFPRHSGLPGLEGLENAATKRAATSVTSNSLLSLAKIFQDGMNPSAISPLGFRSDQSIQDILALYYLSLSLQPSPSTANNVGILLASIPNIVPASQIGNKNDVFMFPGVLPGSGIALALMYYKYGLNLDHKHAHLFTNLGSLLKDIGQLTLAIQMYDKAVACDANFDIALANLANAVKDQGKVADAISYYKRAVKVNPSFAEAVCGLANALNSVCEWNGRGGVRMVGHDFDRWHVDENGGLADARVGNKSGSGWIQRTIDIVENQLLQGQSWGMGVIQDSYANSLSALISVTQGFGLGQRHASSTVQDLIRSWRGRKWEGARIVWLVERAIRRIGWQWYQDKNVRRRQLPLETYKRPSLPSSLSVPNAPTVLPFHTFTLPMNAKQIRLISQRNGLRVSTSTLRASWLPKTVFPPPSPPSPQLKVGYVSSDFNNHPLAHLMQSVFGMHDSTKINAYCYATTASDNSVHRQQIEKEAPHFFDASSWPTEKLVQQIVEDGIHILVNLNGYTRGARNEIFAARPAPLQMSFMGFAGTLGAEWCDYLLADETAVPSKALRPWRRNIDISDLARNENVDSDNDDWVYAENIIYTRDTFFCCDHRQSGSQPEEKTLTWDKEQRRRMKMRKTLFPDLPEDAIIFGNFNQLYKIDPTTFRTWLRILSRVPNSYLWLLRFPADGANNLLRTATAWAGPSIAARILFTDVAPKSVHINRGCIADLFLDTPECNAHTTAADCLWSGTPLLTLPRYEWKMCSRMAAGILGGTLHTDTEEGQAAWDELVANSEEDYEETAVRLGRGLHYFQDKREKTETWEGRGRLMELRKMVWEGRWSCKLFDTQRWVGDLEVAYQEAWRRWVEGEGGDIWLKDL